MVQEGPSGKAHLETSLAGTAQQHAGLSSCSTPQHAALPALEPPPRPTPPALDVCQKFPWEPPLTQELHQTWQVWLSLMQSLQTRLWCALSPARPEQACVRVGLAPGLWDVPRELVGLRANKKLKGDSCLNEAGSIPMTGDTPHHWRRACTFQTWSSGLPGGARW